MTLSADGDAAAGDSFSALDVSRSTTAVIAAISAADRVLGTRRSSGGLAKMCGGLTVLQVTLWFVLCP
ncbi:hypothetical protein GCM10010151_50960 [Actinoallomurus spadix]|uniref:Uncharacterized protein n=1 Tax=Actinoallomurus spadix TaxID=79912 RepID=A0ABN0X4X4_9ACTN